MKIAFLRPRDNIVFSHRTIAYDIESNDILNAFDLDELPKYYQDYDWVFCLHDRERIEKIQEVRKYIKVACWSLEDPYELDQDFEVCRKYDYVFSMDEAAVDIRKRLGSKNISLLPLATNTKLYFPEDVIDEQYISDILLVGVAFPLRIKILNGLSDFVQSNNLKLKIIGWWWEKLNNKYLERNCVDKGLFPSDIVRQYYNGTKIVLEINRDLYLTNLKVDATTPGRAFNSLACRKFTISDYRQTTPQYFDLENELIVFKNIEDLKEKILYYMDALNERERIETNGYKRILSSHTIVYRINEMKKILEEKQLTQ